MDFLKREETKTSVYAPSDEEAAVIMADHERINRAYVSVDEQKEMVVRDPFDPAPLIDLFKKYHQEIDKMSNLAQGLRVVDDETNSTATLLTNQAKQVAQAIEKKRTELKAPYLKVTSVLDAETKGLKDRLTQIQAFINSLITPFLQKKEELKRAAERKAAEEAAKIQKELDDKAQAEREQAAREARAKAEAEGLSKKQAEEAAKQAAAMVEEAPQVVMQAPAEVKVQTDAGSAKLKESWDFTVEDVHLLPRSAFEARREQIIKAVEPWINQQIAAGVRQISGVKIFKIAKLNTRTSRGNSTGKW